MWLTEEGRRRFLNAWQEKKQEKITHPFLEEKIPWGLVPYVQSLLLARHLRGTWMTIRPFCGSKREEGALICWYSSPMT